MTKTAAAEAAPETAVTTQPTLSAFEVIERVITNGDLAKMTAADRVAFYWRTCESLGLNPLTRPFEFINLNGKLTMYARKDATDQLRKLNGVSVSDIRREKDDELGLLTVYARGRDKSGREDEATGVVSVKGLSGEALANAVMKAETKAKRRLTLSLVGLGFLDESELDGVARVDVDPITGEITEAPKAATLLDRVNQQRQALAGEATAEQLGDVDEADVITGQAVPAGQVANPHATLGDLIDAGAVADPDRDRLQPEESLTREALLDYLDQAEVSRTYALDLARRVIADFDGTRQLTGPERAQLRRAIEAERKEGALL